MKQYTNQEQTEIFDRLNFPESESRKFAEPDDSPTCYYAYSIGEMIAFIDELPSPTTITITRVKGDWMVSVGDTSVREKELKDALFLMSIKLRVNGVI